MKDFVIFLTGVLIFSFGAAESYGASSSPDALFAYEGVLTDSNGQAYSGNRSATFEILLGSCVLYKETTTLNLGTQGEFSVFVGRGNRQDSTGNTAEKIFALSGAVACEGASPQTVTSSQERELRITVGAELMSPNIVIGPVPFAIQAKNAQSLNGKNDGDFVNINNAKGVTKANIESVFDRFAKLDTLLNNFNSAGTTAGINISGNASTATTATNVSGTVAIANGGTGSTTASGARTNLGLGSLATMSPTGTADNTTYLRGDGTWHIVSPGGAVSSVAGQTGAVVLSASDVSGLGSLATKSTSGIANSVSYLRGDGEWTALGGSALLNVGTAPGTVAAGDDPRLTNAVRNGGTDSASRVAVFSAGLDANKPASPEVGQMFVATDTLKIYRYDGSGWLEVANAASGGGPVHLAGDVTGSQGATVVSKIQNVPVDMTSAANGKYFRYSGSSWVLAHVGINDLVSSVTGSTQFTDTTCAANQTLTWTALTDSFLCKNISLPMAQVVGLGVLASKAVVNLSSDVTGTLSVSQGGTGANNVLTARANLGAAASGSNSDILSLTKTTSVASSASLTLSAGGDNSSINLVPTGSGVVDVSSRRIANVATPISSTDAATKEYVDAASTVWKQIGSDIFSTSKVGIGTSTPSSQLHVVGDVRVDGLLKLKRYTSSLPVCDPSLYEHVALNSNFKICICGPDSSSSPEWACLN